MNTKNEFERMAAQNAKPNVVREFWEFLRYNRKYWLLPILLFLLILGGLLVLSTTGAAPFIYAIF